MGRPQQLFFFYYPGVDYSRGGVTSGDTYRGSISGVPGPGVHRTRCTVSAARMYACMLYACVCVSLPPPRRRATGLLIRLPLYSGRPLIKTNRARVGSISWRPNPSSAGPNSAPPPLATPLSRFPGAPGRVCDVKRRCCGCCLSPNFLRRQGAGECWAVGGSGPVAGQLPLDFDGPIPGAPGFPGTILEPLGSHRLPLRPGRLRPG